MIDRQLLIERIDRAIAEDFVGSVDVTTAPTIPATQRCIAEFRTRKSGVVSGIDVAIVVLDRVCKSGYEVLSRLSDGNGVGKDVTVLKVSALTREMLVAERTALNFLSRLSGISSATHIWVEAIAGTRAKIRDTRKTTPGWRDLEKYAVRMGGGVNHRLNLAESALIKDNHIAAVGGITEAVAAIKTEFPHVLIEVEIDRLDQLAEAIAAGADEVLLDNMSPEQCAQAVVTNQGRVKLEASGGITLDTVREYAQTGVDFIAVGAITHSAPILDIGLDLSEVY
jgi:nicotinate-nucleotide pyrophosphorylase (carboxylating)